MSEVEDVVALQRLLSEYGHIMDAQDWPGLASIFTDDAVCDWTPFGLERTNGLAELQTYFARIRHPNAHHVTNVIVDVDGGGDTARVRSKLLVALDDGSVATGDYVDEAVRTDAGWRIRHRIATPRPRPTRSRTRDQP